VVYLDQLSVLKCLVEDTNSEGGKGEYDREGEGRGRGGMRRTGPVFCHISIGRDGTTTRYDLGKINEAV
jgi:hypothetical protein